jgi:hypothetical protein
MLLPRTTGGTIHREDDWFVRRDGSMFPFDYWSAPIDTPSGRGAVVAFTDVEERLAKEQAQRERDIAQARAAEARAAQRRMAAVRPEVEVAPAPRRAIVDRRQLAARRAGRPSPAQADLDHHPLAAEGDPGDRGAGQSQEPVECRGDAHARPSFRAADL